MVMPLVAGFLIGYVLDREGRRLMVVCPPGERPPSGFTPLPQPVSAPPQVLPQSVREAFVLEPIDERLADIAPYTAATTYYCTELLDARLASKVLIVLTNTTGDALTVQVVGHTHNSPSDVNGLINIGSTQVLPATNLPLGLGVDLQTDWYPYLGVTVLSDASPPSTGRVIVRAYGQRWRNIAAMGQRG